MNDLTPMPFGCHKDTPMQDVPASYLHWLWTECGFRTLKTRDARGDVAAYIRANLTALMDENRDLIWDA